MNSKGEAREVQDDSGLFLERLQTLFDKSLGDLRVFAERESRPFDEVRDQVAKWYCKYLFDPTLASEGSLSERVSSILRSTSRVLETLDDIAGLQSFFLVVNPSDPSDEGFLGGTPTGREFWRCHRGCGGAGAKLFHEQCIKAKAVSQSGVASIPEIQMVNAPPKKKGPASSLKTEVYTAVRSAIRAASGVRNAEMKWSDHSRLDTYGVRVVGWPTSVPLQNPSTLSVAQNRQVLDAIHNGSMYFERIVRASGNPYSTSIPRPGDMDGQRSVEENTDISWAYQDPDEPVSSLSPPVPVASDGSSVPAANAQGESYCVAFPPQHIAAESEEPLKKRSRIE